MIEKWNIIWKAQEWQEENQKKKKEWQFKMVKIDKKQNLKISKVRPLFKLVFRIGKSEKKRKSRKPPKGCQIHASQI